MGRQGSPREEDSVPRLRTALGRAALLALGLAAFSCTGVSPRLEPQATGQVVGVDANDVVTSTDGGGTEVPSGCRLTANPSSGGPGPTAVELTLACTAGTLPISVAWSGGLTPGDCPTSMDSLSEPCTVSGVSQTTRWTVSQFSSSAGDGTGNSDKYADFTYTAGPGGEWANCPANTLKVTDLYPRGSALPYGQDGTYMWGPLPTGATMSVKMAVPANKTGTGHARFTSSYGGSRTATWSISEKACDLVNGVKDTDTATWFTLYLVGSTGGNLQATYSYGSTKTLKPGSTYYFNIRMDSCDSDDCYYSNVELD